MAVAFGGYVNLVNSTSAGAKTEINANISRLLALIPQIGPTDGAASGTILGSASPVPGFDQIHPRMVVQLRAELVALQAAITNGA